jgi:hypothetical protein
MAEGEKFSYSGQQAYNIYKSILDNATSAKEAYDKAIKDWSDVQEYLKVTGLSAKIDEVTLLQQEEIKKVVNSLSNMMGSVQNVDSSWQGVAAEVNAAIDTYKNSDGGNA